MFSGTSRDVNVHNIDGSTGQKPTGASLSVALSTEQQATLDYIKNQLNATMQDIINTLTSLSITATVSGPVALKNVANAQINPATEDTLALIKTKTDNLDMALTALLSSLKGAGNKDLTTIQTTIDDTLIAIDGLQTFFTTNFDVLLSTRATEATLLSIKGKTDNLNVLLSSVATETTLSAINTKVPADPAREGGNLASIKTDADTIATNTGNIPADPAREGGNLASIKTDTDTIVTNTTGLAKEAGGHLASMDTKLPADPAREGGNLASVKTNTDKLDVNLSTVAKESGGHLASIDTKIPADPAREGGNIATIKTDVDTLVNSAGGGFVRQDSTGTIAKESGGHLASIDTKVPSDPAREGGNLASIKTDVDTLVNAGAGGFIRQDSTGTIAKEAGGNLSVVKTNTDPLVTPAGGGYVRQDSTGTIAKETGGNLASVKTNTDKLDVLLSTRLSELDFDTKIGDNSATPVANTVKDWLKQIITQLTTQVRGLFDSAGNAISSALNFTDRRLLVSSLPSIARYVDQNQVFSATADGISLPTAGTNTPVLYLNNPSGSGKTLLIKDIMINGESGGTNYYINNLANPTVTANGTALTMVNNKIGSGTTAVALAYSSPTVTGGTGNIVEEYSVGKDANVVIRNVDYSLQIPANNRIVLIGNPGANGKLISITVKWVEV